MIRAGAILASLSVLLAAEALGSRQPGSALRFLAPAEDEYLSGPIRLRLAIEPAAAASDVTELRVFADGRQVCTLQTPPFECDWDAGERLVDHQFRAVAVLRNGQNLVQTVRTKGVPYVEEVDVDVVRVTAVVTDENGSFVRGLRQTDFRVFEDDRPQPITSFAAENIPLEMVVALDVSSSMREFLPQVKDAAKRFLAGLEARDRVTLLAFNDNIFTLVRQATNQAARERAINLMESWGGTALYDAIIRAIDVLGRQTGRRSLVLFSDGDDQSSHVPLKTAIARTEGSDATIYAIGQGRAVRSRDLQRLMQQVARVSGGQAFFTENTAELDGIFSRILEDLRNQYFLSYPAPTSQRDGRWHAIRLEVAGGRYKVRAREGYRLTRN
ncbi:MAG TPA: VWA domain-containing protein [Vicinamibacterales bacterium]|nr:VWA domain-containing protein [Vicinamibacterales bacterium]